jgi:hypothetical protein
VDQNLDLLDATIVAYRGEYSAVVSCNGELYITENKRKKFKKVGSTYEIQNNIGEEAFDFYIRNFCDTHDFLSFIL